MDTRLSPKRSASRSRKNRSLVTRQDLRDDDAGDELRSRRCWLGLAGHSASSRGRSQRMVAIRFGTITVLRAGVAQLAERQPSKLHVASSNLVSRSTPLIRTIAGNRATAWDWPRECLRRPCGRHGSCECASQTSSGSSPRTSFWPSVCGSSSSSNVTARSPATTTGRPPVLDDDHLQFPGCGPAPGRVGPREQLELAIDRHVPQAGCVDPFANRVVLFGRARRRVLRWT